MGKFRKCAFSLLILAWNTAWGENQNNVCKTIEDYFDDIAHNPNCWYDGDVTATPEQLARNHGFILEKHTVVTDDEYILTTFRLKSDGGLYGKEVIFLQHGLGADALCFMANGNKSIAFFLAWQGFDVWLGNSRGTDFGHHESLSRDNPKFWDFSFHELGLYDVSANFKYITNKTKRKITYIGHSMGTTTMGVYASMKPEESATYLKHAILVSPALYLKNMKGYFSPAVIGDLYGFMVRSCSKEEIYVIPKQASFSSQGAQVSMLSHFGNRALLPVVNMHVIMATGSYERKVMDRICFESLENARLCLNFIETFTGKSHNLLSPEKFPIALKLARNFIFKCLLHYAQMIQSQDFRMFDYGPKINRLKYNSTTPPSYPFSEIIIPMSLVYCETDVLTTKLDTQYAFETYRKPNWDINGIPDGHVSFLLNDEADKTIFPLLLRLINKYT